MKDTQYRYVEPVPAVAKSAHGIWCLRRMNHALEALRVVRTHMVTGAEKWYNVNGMMFQLAKMAEDYGLGVQYSQKSIEDTWYDEDVECFYVDKEATVC